MTNYQFLTEPKKNRLRNTIICNLKIVLPI